MVLKVGTIGVVHLLFRDTMVFCKVHPKSRLLEEAHCTKLTDIGFLAGVRHLMEPTLVGILELFVTIAALVCANFHSFSMNLHQRLKWEFFEEKTGSDREIQLLPITIWHGIFI